MTDHDQLAAQAQQAAAARDYARAHDLLDQLIAQLRAEGRHLRIRPLLEQKLEIYLQMIVDDGEWTALELISLLRDLSDNYGRDLARPLHERVLAAVERATGPDSLESKSLRNSLDDLQFSHTHSQRWARLRQGPGDVHAQVLEGIDDIPWADLHHAYGSAADVPGLLRGLLNDDEDVREDVLEQLFSTIHHQGTVYEASAYAVPFLLRLLAWKYTPDKASVLELLACIAHGHSYLAVHARDEEEQRRWDAILAERGSDFTTELARELRWVEAANTAAAEGLPLYFRLLYDADDRLRRGAIEILGYFPQHRDAIIPQLQEARSKCESEAEQQAITGALEALGTQQSHEG